MRPQLRPDDSETLLHSALHLRSNGSHLPAATALATALKLKPSWSHSLLEERYGISINLFVHHVQSRYTECYVLQIHCRGTHSARNVRCASDLCLNSCATIIQDEQDIMD